MIKNLQPDLYYRSVFEIELYELKKIGVKGIICDVDNTIVEWSKEEINEEVKRWFSKLLELGFKVCLVSNGFGERVENFSRILDIPAVGKAVKPAKRSYKKAQKILGLESSEVVVVGDQIFTDILGGNRLSFMTILVDPLHEKEFFTTKFFRILEKMVFTRNK